MPRDDGNAGVDRVVMGGMDAALVAVFYHHMIRRPATPAWNPGRKVIGELEPANVHELGHRIRQPVLEARVMVPERPDELGFACGILNLTERHLARLQLLDDGRLRVPPDPGKPAYGCTVESIAVIDYGFRLECFDSPEQSLEGSSADARPEVRVREDQHHAILDAKAMPCRRFMRVPDMRQSALKSRFVREQLLARLGLQVSAARHDIALADAPNS